MQPSNNILIKGLLPDEIKIYEKLLDVALTTDPQAFGKSLPDVNKNRERYFNRIASKIKTGRRMIIIAVASDAVVGMVSIKFAKSTNFSHIARFTEFFVSPESRGMGIGEKLLKEAERICVEKNIKKIKLTVNERQERAISLYQKLGYTLTAKLLMEMKIKDSYYDAILFEKII